MGNPVTDPALLAKLNGATSREVTDPELLRQLNGGAFLHVASQQVANHRAPASTAAETMTTAIPTAKAAAHGPNCMSTAKMASRMPADCKAT